MRRELGLNGLVQGVVLPPKWRQLCSCFKLVLRQSLGAVFFFVLTCPTMSGMWQSQGLDNYLRSRSHGAFLLKSWWSLCTIRLKWCQHFSVKSSFEELPVPSPLTSAFSKPENKWTVSAQKWTKAPILGLKIKNSYYNSLLLLFLFLFYKKQCLVLILPTSVVKISTC